MATLGIPLKTFVGMSEVEFYFYVLAASRREERLSEMLGKHLGTLLDAHTLQSLFFDTPSQTDPIHGVDESESKIQKPPKGLFTPLALLVNPEITDHIKERAKSIIEIRTDKKTEVEVPGVDLDQAEFLKLQAMARRVDKLRKKMKYQRPEDDPSKSWSIGIDEHIHED